MEMFDYVTNKNRAITRIEQCSLSKISIILTTGLSSFYESSLHSIIQVCWYRNHTFAYNFTNLQSHQQDVEIYQERVCGASTVEVVDKKNFANLLFDLIVYISKPVRSQFLHSDFFVDVWY